MKRITLCVLFIAVITFAVAFQSGAQQESGTAFDMKNAMVPMRDGVKLSTNIFIPKNAAGPLPLYGSTYLSGTHNGPCGALVGRYKKNGSRFCARSFIHCLERSNHTSVQ